MGIKSIINTDRLYWLGRYSERVYTTLKLFEKSFDLLIEDSEADHKSFCASLEIPDIYTDKEDFLKTYPFSSEDPNSVMSNLRRAYDNAIELRDEIGSESLSYIQLAIYEMERANLSDAPVLYFQSATDCLLAFWGSIDDQIDDENTRNIIKIGKRVERLDLYARLGHSRESLIREVDRLTGRIDRTDLIYNHELLEKLNILVRSNELDYHAIINTTELLMEC